MKKIMCPPQLLFALVLKALSVFFVCMAVPNTKLPESEVAALRAIARQMNNGKWDFTVDPCSGAPGWSEYQSRNVNRTLNCTCDPQICHVSVIALRGQNLTGVLPKEFADLVNLTVLDLSRNYLNGSIPREWGSLPLNHLSLVGNLISGTIPDELGNMTSLQNLTLNDNQLSGQIPEALGKLNNLNLLKLSGNNLTGELPESLGNLKNLTFFEIDGNPIIGKIPTFIGNWTQLKRLDLQGTSLEGSFPPIFANLSNIEELRVTDLAGDGKFPPLQNMKNMRYLTLRNLSISGQLPPDIGFLPISILDLSFNNLSGSIPDRFENLQNSLNFMFLSNNILTGAIPNWILSDNKAFDLSNNNFTGQVPSNCQKELVNLASSHSPSDSSELNACFHRDLPCLGKRKNYDLFINCGGKKLTIDNTVYEEDLDYHGESTYSANSNNKWAFSSMGAFVDGGNKPSYIVTNTSVLTMNNLELYTTARRTAVSLRYYGFCLQKGNYTVMLHFAEITFTNDETYFSVGRRIFDVIIQGKKVLQDFDIAKEANRTGKEIIKKFTTFVDGTLDIHLYWAGKGTSGVPQLGTYGPIISAISVKPNFTPDTGKLSVGAILGIIAGSLVVFFILLALLWFCIRRKISEYNELKSLKLQIGYFTLKQIKAATRNFNLANKIGEGGFGPVYKGVMPDRTEIAVKQLSSKSKQGNREFVNEIGMISGLQHPNLVKLFGCCVEGNQLLLIYEYMENNSLARALFGPEKSRLKLDWQTRLKICLDIARGLAYLHEESRLKIVHRDIKATNILLDKDLNAKISDFGLAKLNEEENTHISTRIAGTVGYMAPEYATRGYLTDKADVYSFGIVILEIISGVSNTKFKSEKDSPMKKQFSYLLDWVYVLQEQGRLLELVDPRLGSDYSKEEALQILNLALICTSPSPSLRPMMSTVVSILDGKTLIQAPTTKGAVLESMDMRFKAFETASHDSQLQSITADGPFTGSSISGQSIIRETPDLPTEKLLSDDSGVCTEVFSGR